MRAPGRCAGSPRAQEDRLWRLISARGYRRQEPVDIGVDQVEIIDEMVRVHLEELGFSVADLAKALWLREEEFRQIFLGGRAPGPTGTDGASVDAGPKPRLRLVE
jgi:hypothetical protein